MTGSEAWKIILRNLATYEHIRNEMGLVPFTKEEIEAQVICCQALKKLDKEGIPNESR